MISKFPLRAFILSTIAFSIFIGSIVQVFFFAGSVFERPIYIISIIASGAVLGLFYSWVVYNRVNK